MSELDGTGSRSAVRSVERAFAALDYLVAIAPRAARVTDVAQHLGLSLAGASRLLATMSESGYACRTGDRRFTVGPRSLPLAQDWITRVRAAAAVPVARAAAASGESVMLAQLLGDTLVPVAWQPPQQRAEEMAARFAEMEARLPLFATATGRSTLGKLPPGQRARLLETHPFPKLTPRTVTGAAELNRRIAAAERTGLYIDRGEVEPDLWCCAVALGPGPMGEVLSLSVISFEPQDETRMYNLLRREIRDVGNALQTAG